MLNSKRRIPDDILFVNKEGETYCENFSKCLMTNGVSVLNFTKRHAVGIAAWFDEWAPVLIAARGFAVDFV